jgi:hypothetical protein
MSSNDSDERCPFIMIRGNRKGQTCNEKIRSEGSKYCRAHLRTIGVKMEMGDIPRSHSLDDMKPDKPKPINDKYKPIVLDSVTIKKPDVDKKKGFATAFAKHLDKKTSDPNENIDMEEIYNDVDIADDVEDDEIPVEEDENLKYYKKELESAREETLKAQRKINSMFTMKQLLFTGVKTVSDVGEKLGGDNMKGYSNAVMTSDAINSLLDEMSDDLETIIGFSELPASVRLLATMGVIGSSVYTKNLTGVSVKEINPKNVPAHVPKNQPEEEEVDVDKEEKFWREAEKEYTNSGRRFSPK